MIHKKTGDKDMFLNKEVEINHDSIIIQDSKQTLKIEAWGDNTIRVVCSPHQNFKNQEIYGIKELNKNGITSYLDFQYKDKHLKLSSGKLSVIYDGEKLSFYHKDKLVLEEFSRKQSDVRRTVGIDDDVPIRELPTSSLNVSPRKFVFNNNICESSLIFEGSLDEKIFGMGGYQEENINKNLGTYELMHRNSQTSIPFYISSKGYGFIWNNSSIGEVNFSRNQRKWKSKNSEIIDYIVTVGDSPKDIIGNYTTMTGKPPLIDQRLLGLWQSKLRYQTTEEVKAIYENYVNKGIKLSVIVIDYYHWTADGDFEFDMDYWEDIDLLAAELKKHGTQIMVSLWPTVSESSKYCNIYNKNKMIIRGKNGENKLFNNLQILDFSNPDTVKFFKKLLKNNYLNNGISLFWADQAEPEMTEYNHSKYLVYEGDFEKVGNRYPYFYVKAIQDNTSNPILIRSAWFNSQKYGALAWSGDIDSSFSSLRKQIQISISMGISGIPWWTSDIGGFHSGDSNSDLFKELLIRWFQFSVFSPILRMHGDRQPHSQKIGSKGGGIRTSGGPNEIWSFGEKVENILTNQIKLRERLHEYLLSVYEESTRYGYPIIRGLFLEFPEDNNAWEDTTNFMLGSELLVAPVVNEKIKSMKIYLPKGRDWIDVYNGDVYRGGHAYNVEITLEKIPVFCIEGSNIGKNRSQIFNIQEIRKD